MKILTFTSLSETLLNVPKTIQFLLNNFYELLADSCKVHVCSIITDSAKGAQKSRARYTMSFEVLSVELITTGDENEIASIKFKSTTYQCTHTSLGLLI
jgi:hypothetical protein